MSALTIYPYQLAWLKSRARFRLGMFARQTGKSFTSTLAITDDVLDAESIGRRSNWVMLSAGERQAKELVRDGIARHLEAYKTAFKALEYDWGRADDGLTIKAQEIVFPGGSRVTALPANPNTARGYSRNIYLDEFAFHRDSRAIWRAVFPIVTRGYKCWITSTPNGKGNKFYDLATADDASWEIHRCDIHRAAAEGYPVDVEALRKGLRDEDAWAQEYELQWLDDASAWLSYDLIASVESDGAPGIYTGGQTFIGVDIGLRSDLWVAWVLERVGDVLWTRDIRRLRRAKFSEQDAVFDELMELYHPIAAWMDQTGMGEKPVEDAQNRYGSRVQGVLFNPASKQALANATKDTFEDRRVRIPQGDPKLRNALHKVKKAPSETGMPRFIADRDSDGHADEFWALALAISAARAPHIAIDRLEASGNRRQSMVPGGFGAPSDGRIDLGGFV